MTSTNLIGNALKFRKPGVPPRIGVSARRAGAASWEIAVEDDGIGFEQRHARDIFKPLTRLHPRSAYPGSGMGLAICQRIAARHGGAIAAVSSPGRGSTFTITLPGDPP